MDRLIQITNWASLLAVVMALAFMMPMSAHAGMTDHGSMDHHGIGADHAANHNHMPDMDMTPDHTDDSHVHDADASCCSGICMAVALTLDCALTATASDEVHIPLPIAKMTSVDTPRLMRPPSL